MRLSGLRNPSTAKTAPDESRVREPKGGLKMSHECPDCGHTCFCGGDIDDCCFNFEYDVNNCTHCLGKKEAEAEYEANKEDY